MIALGVDRLVEGILLPDGGGKAVQHGFLSVLLRKAVPEPREEAASRSLALPLAAPAARLGDRRGLGFDLHRTRLNPALLRAAECRLRHLVKAWSAELLRWHWADTG